MKKIFVYTNIVTYICIRMNSSDSRYWECLYFSANVLARKIEKLAGATWKQVDLSPSHAYLLMIVLEEPGVQPGTLSDELQLTPSTITRLIEKLEEKNFVVRTVTGKITNLYPTPKAKKLLPELRKCVHQFQEEYTKILGREESTRLVNNIHKLANKLP